MRSTSARWDTSPKSAAAGEIRSALRALLAGETWLPAALPPRGSGSDDAAALAALLNRLTPQQSRVLMLLSDGMLNKQIAHAMQVSEATVKAHVSAILQKLGVDNRTQAVIVARRLAVEVGEPGAEPAPPPADPPPAVEPPAYSAAWRAAMIRVASALSAAGLIGLLRTCRPCASAAALTACERSAVINTAGISAASRRRSTSTQRSPSASASRW